MLKNISILAVLAVVLVACGGGGGVTGFAQLGSDFARAFAQDRNAEPISLENVTLVKTPLVEPFNP
ncbi:hypothetical protein SAMN04488523_102137 [Sulfitobacter brevis]|uniref:Uncharacterized protein n=1 Tax=Sulfitobacter brevis TaxID=74348 RepID=A0A1I1UIY9_9RHOB|nr:hypothetical protein [Sulfitobacter brevis]SFD70674.1 hypothetical protein SAMN04488523_102137 [Sulfitobacter brevis]